MRSESDISKDIAYLKNDIAQLRTMGGSCAIALDDLEDLYAELRIAKQSPDGESNSPMVSIEEYSKLIEENQRLTQDNEILKNQIVKTQNEYSLKIDKLANRSLWERIMNKSTK